MPHQPHNPTKTLSDPFPMPSVECYHRWQAMYDGSDIVDSVRFMGPDADEHCRPIFIHQPVEILYDDRGYEAISPLGNAVQAVRFTPNQPGNWRYAWLSGDRVMGQGRFTCLASDHPGFVEISEHDPRYFAFSNGNPYVPIGLNLSAPEMFALSTGHEFKTSARHESLGSRQYERWFRSLSQNGGNFARLWLGAAYFQPETEIAGELNRVRFAALDRVVELARHYNIRLKLCLEYFRVFGEGAFPSRVLQHPETGRPPTDMDEWFQSPDWQALWRRKLNAFLARYGDDPVVMAWELWNEINCCYTNTFQVLERWTRDLLNEIKAASPRNLVTNSLGSFDGEGSQILQDAFKMNEMDFQQVHRYLDQGAPLAICRTDPTAFSIDAIQRSRRPDRPVILAETGAVNDCHSGPFRFYGADHDGLIFHDTTYPAFFAGAAGSGHIWHWDCYVDRKNLWHGFRALSDALQDVAVDSECFTPLDQSTDDYWRLVLQGQTVSLVWLRNRYDRWDQVLRDGKTPPLVSTACIDLETSGTRPVSVELFRPWPNDGRGQAVIEDKIIHLPAFRHGLICRIWHKAGMDNKEA